MDVFATAVICVDGRIQEPVQKFLKKKYRVDFVDVITEPGPAKILAEHSDIYKIKSIKQRLDMSVENSGSRIILMGGHHDCSSNPVEKDTHIAQILNASALLKEWYPDVNVIPVWISERWEVEPL